MAAYVARMGRDRVWLHEQTGVRRLRRWRSDHTASSHCRYITVGTVDGRWFAEQTRQRGAVICRDERDAYDQADRWMRGGQWWETPAEFDARHQPTEPGWRKTGSLWVRVEQMNRSPINGDG